MTAGVDLGINVCHRFRTPASTTSYYPGPSASALRIDPSTDIIMTARRSLYESAEIFA